MMMIPIDILERTIVFKIMKSDPFNKYANYRRIKNDLKKYPTELNLLKSNFFKNYIDKPKNRKNELVINY